MPDSFTLISRYVAPAVVLLLFARPGWTAPPSPDESNSSGRDLQGDPLPQGALARLGTTRLRPGDPRCCFAISPDSKVLATGEDKIRFWDVATGKEIRSVAFPDHVYDVRSIAISPDGKLFAANGDNLFPVSHPPWDQSTIYVGEIATGKILRKIKEEEKGYTELEFSTDGKLLAAKQTGSFLRHEGAELVVWDPQTDMTIQRFSDVQSWSFAPEGKAISIGHKDGSISLYDLNSGRELKKFSGHQNAVLAMAFSPDGKALATASGETERGRVDKDKVVDRTVRLWDVTTGKERRQIKVHEEKVNGLSFSGDGQTMLSQDVSGMAFLWETATGKKRHEFHAGADGGVRFAFSPTDKQLVRSTRDNLQLWDFDAGKEVRHWEITGRYAAHVAFSPDGKVLASCGDYLQLWDMATGKEMHSYPGHRTAVASVAFSQDRTRLISCGYDRSLYLWDTTTRKPLVARPANQKNGVILYSLVGKGGTLAAVRRDGLVHVWNTATGKELRTFRVGEDAPDAEHGQITWLSGRPNPNNDEDYYRYLAFSPNGTTLAVAAADNAVHLWDIDTGKELHRLRGGGERLGRIMFAPDGKTLAGHYESGAINLWDVGSGKEFRHVQGGPIFSISADNRLLAWTDRKEICLWDLVGNKELRRWPSGEYDTDSLAFSGDGKLFAAGGDTLIRLWQTESLQEVRRIEGPDRSELGSVELHTARDGRIFAHYSMDGKNSSKALVDLSTGCRIGILYPYRQDNLELAPDGDVAAKGTDTIELRALPTGKILITLPAGHRGPMTALAYSPDGKRLASASTDGTILIWDTSSANRERFPAAFTFTARELEDLWTKLAPRDRWDRREAYHTLLGTPQQTVPFLRERIQSLTVPDPKQIASWVADLDSDDFKVRKNAFEELGKLGKLGAPVLRRALDKKPSAELTARAEELLDPDGLGGKLPAEFERAGEALFMLEQLNTPEALKLLKDQLLASPGSWLAGEAKAALDRLEKRKEGK